LDYCIKNEIETPQEQEKKIQKPISEPLTEAKKINEVSKHKKRQVKTIPPIAPDNLPPSYFVSASYDGRQKKAVIKLYEPESEQIYFWYDNTGHKPYCLTSIPQRKWKNLNTLKIMKALMPF